MKYMHSEVGEWPAGIPVIARGRFGVFAGELIMREGDNFLLKNARRIWRWAGAMTLSQLTMEGTKIPQECLFPVEVGEVFACNCSEVVKMTEQAVNSINSVAVWGV